MIRSIPTYFEKTVENHSAYFQKILSFTRREYPEGMIRRLVVTTKYRDFRFISQIYQALEKLGIGKDRAMVVDRRQCFVYYVMNQKKDLWVNQVGVFDYEDHEITYFQMHVDRYQHPPFVTVMETISGLCKNARRAGSGREW